MTKNQRNKLINQIIVFVLAFSLLIVCIPYVAIIVASYFAIQIARQV